MEIVYYEKLQQKLIPSIYELACMIEESIHEPVNITFGKIYELLVRKKGIFFICYVNKEEISFGFLSNGGYDKKHKRLMFFVVKKDYRNQSLGKNILRKVIKDKIYLDSGCMLACKAYLEKFYGELGFKVYNKVHTSKDEITMLLSSTDCNIEKVNFGFYNDVEVREDYSKIYEGTTVYNNVLYKNIFL